MTSPEKFRAMAIYVVAACLAGIAVTGRTFAAVISWLDILSIFIATLVLLAIAISLARWLGRRTGAGVAAAAMAAFAVYAANSMVLTPTGLSSSEVGADLLLLVLLVGGSTLVLMRRAAWYVALTLGIATILITYGAVQRHDPVSQGIRQTEIMRGLDTGYDPFGQISRVELQRRPDVYLFAISAGGSVAMQRQHLGLQEFPLAEFLVGEGFEVFGNAFTEAQLTRNSYDQLLAMHRDQVAEISPVDHGTLATGNVPSPLFQTFREGGYEVSVLAEVAKLGVKGGHIDFYRTAEPVSVCNFHFLENRTKNGAFLHACSVRKLFNRITSATVDDLNRMYADHWTMLSEREAPQLVFLHHRPPYHYRGPKLDTVDLAATAEFAEDYAGWMSAAADSFGKILSAIDRRGREAVVVVFGDHGFSLSDLPKDAELTNFFVHDRYAVFLAARTGGMCDAELADARADGFVTTNEVVRQVLICLSGQDPYPPGYKHLGVRGDQTFEFDSYLYE